MSGPLLDDKAMGALLDAIKEPMDAAGRRIGRLRAALVEVVQAADAPEKNVIALRALHADALTAVAESSPKEGPF